MGFLVWKPGAGEFAVCANWPACRGLDDGCEDCAYATADLRGAPAW